MKGRFEAYKKYEECPHIDMPIEEIYAELDSGTMEDDELDPKTESIASAHVLVPPVYYDKRLVKGVLWSRCSDYLAAKYPRIKEAFYLVATSFWCSYPMSQHADAYLTLYNNHHRTDWFKGTNPEKSDKFFLPFHDADCFNEYFVAPQQVQQIRTHDVVVVSRLDPVKNLWIIAEALKAYHQKYGTKLSCIFILGTDLTINKELLGDQEREEYRKIERVLPHISDYITIIPKVTDYSKTMEYLARAKVCVLGSLLEGKNRAIFEAMGCNTPVVCFQDYIKFVRGNQPVFPVGCGLTAPYFSGESLADTIHTVLENQGEFKPRRSILEVSGRKKTLGAVLSAIPHFRDTIPDFDRSDLFTNLWYDLAVQDNYQLSLAEFVFDKHRDLSNPSSERLPEILGFYLGRLDYFDKYRG